MDFVGDIILDRKEGYGYSARDFYNECMNKLHLPFAMKLARALDSGENKDIQKLLCEYAKHNLRDSDICDFIKSVDWLEDEQRTKGFVQITPEGILALAQTQGLTWKELAESLEEEDLEEVVECLENAILKVIPEFDYEADRESPLPWAMPWLYAKNQQVTKADEFVNDIKDELSKLI
jgi:hypothetical protein